MWCSALPWLQKAPIDPRHTRCFLDVYNQYANGLPHRFNINFQLGNPLGVLRRGGVCVWGGQYRTIQSKGFSKLQALMFSCPRQLTYCLFSLAGCKHRLRPRVIGRETDGSFSTSAATITWPGFWCKAVICTNKSSHKYSICIVVVYAAAVVLCFSVYSTTKSRHRDNVVPVINTWMCSHWVCHMNNIIVISSFQYPHCLVLILTTIVPQQNK